MIRTILKALKLSSPQIHYWGGGHRLFCSFFVCLAATDVAMEPLRMHFDCNGAHWIVDKGQCKCNSLEYVHS